jgi:hypothetical protein
MKPELKITTAIPAALLAGACSQQDDGWGTVADRDTAICTDRSGHRVPDADCQQHASGGVSPFLWYYLGRRSAVPYYGDPVSGGSYQRAIGSTYYRAPAESSMTRSAAISRGGFGSSAEGHGGGGEGGAGE